MLQTVVSGPVLRRLAVSPDPVIPTDVARRALRITHGLEDDVLERKLRAAVELVEAKTTRVLRPTDFELTLPAGYDWAVDVDLPVFPIRDVARVEYRTQAGPWAEALDGDYDLRRTHEGGELFLYPTLAPGGVLAERSNLRVLFSAGYGDAGDGPDVDPELELPSRVEELVLLLAGHWMEHREAVTSGDLAEVPLGAELLIQELRIYR